MARPCRACGRRNEGSFAHCLNPACAVRRDPPPHESSGEQAPPATSPEIAGIVHIRGSRTRRLVLPLGIALLIVVSGAHALTAEGGPLMLGAGQSATPTPAQRPTAGAPRTQPSPTAPERQAGRSPAPGPSQPPAAQPSDGGPGSGGYQIKSPAETCFDLGHGQGGVEIVVQRPCTAEGRQARFELDALGSGRYRMIAVPQHGVDAQTRLCATATAAGKALTLLACGSARADQVFTITLVNSGWYQIKAGSGCVAAVGQEAQTLPCANSQAQRFALTPIN